MSSFDRAVAASRHTLRTLVSLGDQLNDVQWAARTECPEWSVGDIFAHVIGVESWVIEGAPRLDGVVQDWIDAAVLSRRGLPRTAVMDQLREVVARREEQLTTGLPDPEQIAFAAWAGVDVTYAMLLATRSFDLWTHEQDIRRALGRPGNLGSASAVVTRDLLLLGLPKIVAKLAGAPAGSTVRLTTLGAVPTDVAVQVGADGRARLVPTGAGRATAHLTMSWETFARISAGRGSRASYDIWFSGDRELGARVAACLNVAH